MRVRALFFLSNAPTNDNFGFNGMNFSEGLFPSFSHTAILCRKSFSLARSVSYPWRLLVESSFIFSAITMAVAEPLSEVVDVFEDSSGGGGATEGGCEPVPAAVLLLAVELAGTPVVDCCSRNCRRRFLIHSSWQS